MSTTLFILGAGASRSAGGPLMDDFIEAAEAIKGSKAATGDKDSLELFFRALAELDIVHAKARVQNLRNLETILGLFDAARISGRLGKLSPGDVERLEPAIRRVIVKTLETRIKLPRVGEYFVAPPPYGDFVSLVGHMIKRGRGPVSYINLYYDVALDFALHRQHHRVNYCLDSYTPMNGVPVMKLHGSVNWARCQECKKVIPYNLGDYLQKHHWGQVSLGPLATSHLTLAVGSHLSDLEHCGKPCDEEAVIVPPTWNKPQYRNDVEPVWHNAAQHFADAEYIYVIGFSLPPTDEFFRYLYSVGAIGPSRIKKFEVINPDKEARDRLRNLLGEGVQRSFVDRGDLNFDQAIREIASELGASIEREVPRSNV